MDPKMQTLLVILGLITVALAVSGNGIGGQYSSTGRNDPRYTPPSQTPTTISGIESELDKIEVEVGRIEIETKEAQKIGERSPLYQQLRIVSASTASSDPTQEYITIEASLSNKSSIALTGLTLKSAVSGRGTSIGNAALLPMSGTINEEAAIFLQPGARAIINSGRSPTGVSFRVNKCVGYFDQFQAYYPSLIHNCPNPISDGYPSVGQKYQDACIDYIEDTPACFMPVNNIPERIGPECTKYVTEKLNYTGCVDRHKTDRDFYRNEYRVYLRQSEEMWKSRRELIKLMDQNGKTIDTYELN